MSIYRVKIFTVVILVVSVLQLCYLQRAKADLAQPAFRARVVLA